MKIVIDARLYGLKHAGIGRYILNLINQISTLDTTNHYIIITSPDVKLEKHPQHFTQITSEVRHYTISEQTKFLKLLNSIDADLFHFPHFNVPFFFNKPFVVTIHDLLWHDTVGFSVTTLNPVKYLIKYLGYRAVMQHSINQARHIMVPTEGVKKDILKRFDKGERKVSVTYESANEIFRSTPENTTSALNKYQLTPPFVIYTGSLYPHKNVISLVKALKLLPKEINLAIVSARNVFADRLWEQVIHEKLDKRVHMLGFVPDKELIKLYHQAIALVQPSQSEGFGLTGLEAMFAGLPVIATDNPVLKEIYKDGALYTDTKDPKKIAHQIKSLLSDPELKKSLSKKATQISQSYSWEKMAKQTLEIYTKSNN